MSWTDGITKVRENKNPALSAENTYQLFLKLSPMVEGLLDEAGAAMFPYRWAKSYSVKSTINGDNLHWSLENDVRFSFWMLQKFHGPNYFNVKVRVQLDDKNNVPTFEVAAGQSEFPAWNPVNRTKSVGEEELKIVLSACIEKAL